AARTFGFTLVKPIFAFDTSESLAEAVTRTDLPLLTLINAQKNLVFASSFRWSQETLSWQRQRALEAITLTELANEIQTPFLCAGDGYDAFQSILDPALTAKLIRDNTISDEPSASVLGRMVWKRLSSKESVAG